MWCSPWGDWREDFYTDDADKAACLSILVEVCMRFNWRVHFSLYTNAFTDGKALREGLTSYFDWYNQERSHQALYEQTPDEVYLGLPPYVIC